MRVSLSFGDIKVDVLELPYDFSEVDDIKRLGIAIKQQFRISFIALVEFGSTSSLAVDPECCQ